jgi:hypothetical protein
VYSGRNIDVSEESLPAGGEGHAPTLKNDVVPSFLPNVGMFLQDKMGTHQRIRKIS